MNRMKALPSSADSSCLLTVEGSEKGCRDTPPSTGALQALSLFIYFPWLPSQGPPGMRGSPGPPGPIVSIRGLLACLRGSQRRRKTQTPFCCHTPGSWAEQKGGTSSAFPSSQHLWGLWSPTSESPRAGLLRPILPVVLLRGGLRAYSCFPHPPPPPIPAVFCTKAHGLDCQESVWQPAGRGQKLRWSRPPWLSRASL